MIFGFFEVYFGKKRTFLPFRLPQNHVGNSQYMPVCFTYALYPIYRIFFIYGFTTLQIFSIFICNIPALNSRLSYFGLHCAGRVSHIYVNVFLVLNRMRERGFCYLFHTAHTFVWSVWGPFFVLSGRKEEAPPRERQRRRKKVGRKERHEQGQTAIDRLPLFPM